MLTLSSWEIELSRFARMYAPFQFVSVCFFWALFRHGFSFQSRKRYLPVALAGAGILTHELGVFLALLLFLPLLVSVERGLLVTIREQWRYAATALVALGAGLAVASFDYRSLGVANDPLPTGFVDVAGQSPHPLAFGTWLLGSGGFLAVAVLGTGFLLAWYVRHVSHSGATVSVEDKILGGLLVLAAASAIVHQFVLCAVLLTIVGLRAPQLMLRKPYAYVVAASAAIAALWIVAFVTHQSWTPVGDNGNPLRAWRLAFLIFPDLYRPAFVAWAADLPVLGSLLCLALAWQIVFLRKQSLEAIAKSPAVVIVVVLLAFGAQPPTVVATRYSQFLYPLALCVGLLAVQRVWELASRERGWGNGFANSGAVACCVLAFGMSEDFNPSHLVHLNSDAVSYRTGEYERFFRHWYPRMDFQRPAELVNADAVAGDKVIVSHFMHTAAAYVKPEFAMWWPRDRFTFTHVSRDGGTREIWSGKQIVSTVEDLIEYTRGADRVWLILKSEEDSLEPEPESWWPGRVENVETYRPGRDGRSVVWRVDLKGAE
jgi:hypothetical protein